MTAYQIKISKPWGYELILTPPEAPTVAKILHLNAGCRFSLQYHELKEETLILISGQAKLITGGWKEIGNLKEEIMKRQSGYFIPRGLVHRCQATTECEIMESSTKEEGTTVRLQDDYGRKDETEEERSRRKLF